MSALIGAVSLSGSLIAWAKLQGVLNKPLRMKGQQILNAGILLATVVVGGMILFVALGGTVGFIATPQLIALFFALALVLGILVTLPIGGADMPVMS
jgi:NAD(P) transhydrogenase subunit beta